MHKFDPAEALANEHIAWAKSYGLEPEDVLRSIGYLVGQDPTWDIVRFALKSEWNKLRRRKALTVRTKTDREKEAALVEDAAVRQASKMATYRELMLLRANSKIDYEDSAI